jgi:L-amino acid N-acyltransferase YncA
VDLRVRNRLALVINTRVDVRPATVDDLAAVNDIYNQYVAETHYTFDIEPMTMDARHQWFTHYDTTGATGSWSRFPMDE